MYAGEIFYAYMLILAHCTLPWLQRAEAYPNHDDSVHRERIRRENTRLAPESSHSLGTRCSGCSSIKEGTEEYKYYIEQTKAKILSKLNMKQAPKPRASRSSIPSPIFSGELLGRSNEDFESHGDGYHGQTKQIIIVNQPGKNYCGSEKCVRFRIKGKLFGASELKSAQLWVYLSAVFEETNTIQVFEVGKEIDGLFIPRNKFLIASRVHSKSTGWFVIDLTRFQSRIQFKNIGSGTVNLILRIRCTGCNIAKIGDRAPFLVMNTNTNRVSRKRRNVDCHAGKEGCCRERVYVNFTTIGWNDWIIQPVGYDANNCRGTCDHTSVPIYGHTSVMRRIGKQIKSCCTAKRLSPISMLYYDDAGYIFKKDIPNMSVEECGCTS